MQAAVERGGVTPAVRAKFQVIALVVREEHAGVQGSPAGSPTRSQTGRVERLKRLDRIATVFSSCTSSPGSRDPT